MVAIVTMIAAVLTVMNFLVGVLLLLFLVRVGVVVPARRPDRHVNVPRTTHVRFSLQRRRCQRRR